MRWMLISLCAALIAATSAQSLTIDNDIVVAEPFVVTPGPEHHSNTPNDDIGHETKSFSNNEFGRAESYESDSNSKPVSNRQSRETSESTHESNEPSNSSEISSTQNASSEIAPSSEEGAIESPSTEGTAEKAYYTETSETPQSVEILLVESSANPELPEEGPPVGASVEGDDNDVIVVNTTQGRVKGFQWKENTEIVAFYDIPYGKFDRPFEKPVSAQSWHEEVHEATEHTTICPQLNENDEYIGVKNCLTLSIFVPKNTENASVLFHIYDGHSSSSSADPLIYGPDYLVPKGVILVLPNYRINSMGFLCMQNETAPGNAGLKDLSLALEWVKDNIGLFGGNPANIVVSGDGTAGAYAGYLALCSRTKDYISKVITESGSALSHWALDRDPTATAYKLADKLRGEHADGVIYNNTFNEMTLETIVKASKGIRFRPCIEHDNESFIDDTPWKIIKNKNHDITFMIGSATYAGTHEAVDTTAEYLAEIDKYFEQLLPEDLVFDNQDERDAYAVKLRNQYFGNDSITENKIDELSLWYTDASYLSPGIRLARSLVEAGATVYLYEFAFVGSLNWNLESLNKPVQGAVRGDLGGYLFRKDGVAVEEDSSEKRMIDLMVDLWVSFINTGTPATADIKWSELKMANDNEEEWLLISSEPKLKKGVHVDRLRLWTDLYQEHFIDNSAQTHTPQPFLALAVALISIISNYIWKYNSY